MVEKLSIPPLNAISQRVIARFFPIRSENFHNNINIEKNNLFLHMNFVNTPASSYYLLATFILQAHYHPIFSNFFFLFLCSLFVFFESSLAVSQSDYFKSTF